MIGSYFKAPNYNIRDNHNLREPQRHAYSYVYKHFILDKEEDHALVVLPTGVGKTALMAISPYGISEGRVLIIAPQLTIKDSLMKSLDADSTDNVWLKFKVFKDPKHLPTVVEFDPKLPLSILEQADIVILNIHKLQERLKKSPLKTLPKNFFDMIIIDEAHHSAAPTWISTTRHFNDAKVLKVTATPLRPDKKEISGQLVYRYKLSQAMAKGYVKSLESIKYIPDRLELTIGDNKTDTYSVEEILEQGIRDEEWVSRSIAYSSECSASVVKRSVELLRDKRQNSNVPHKIIAVASNIEHAEEIAELYSKEKMRTTVLHSELQRNILEQRKLDIENHRCDVVINVAMLGEGYDHKYLSVGAIFRAYRSILPYAQFIGRILRSIPDNEVNSVQDNIGVIVAHQELRLDKLWESYKVEIQESEIIRKLNDIDVIDPKGPSSPTGESRILEFGNAQESETGQIQIESYMDTETLKRYRAEEAEKAKKIQGIMALMDVDWQMAEQIYSTAKPEERLLRPDLAYLHTRDSLDAEIREIIIPEVLVSRGLQLDKNDISDCTLFKNKYKWIADVAKNNGELLGRYINTYLKNRIGRGRADWELDDYQLALQMLPDLREFIESAIDSHLNNF